MGNYNPYAPVILGEEWVPIREELVAFSPQINAAEIGHGFTLAQSRVLQDGRFYIDDFPSGLAFSQGGMVAVYPRGTEASSGPVRRVVIPCNNGTISGDSNNGLRGGALSFAEAMMSPSDGRYVQLTAGGTLVPACGFSAYFATNQYAQMLQGKRILGVNVLFTIVADADLIWTQDPFWRANFRIRQGNTSVTYASTGALASRGSVDPGQAATNASSLLKVQRLGIGQTNYFWQAPTFTLEVQPWTYADLQRFEISAASPISYDVQFGNSGITSFSVGTQYSYAALEVFFCEEQRFAVGAMGSLNSTSGGAYVDSVNIVSMRHPVTRALNPVLTAGAYTTTFTVPDIGDFNNSITDYPNLNGLRELYAIPPHPGYQINVPFPLDESAEGQVFTRDTVHVLPQLSLHTSGGPLTEVHVYGRQARAQVYGSITATQEIFDTGVGGSAVYPQARFYARRFGATTIPLTLDCPSAPTATASITPAAFDALTPTEGIIDGWKEVTLRFTAPPTLGAGTNPQWRWSAAGETAGNRWEVLGANAPALSGLPGNLLNLVLAPHQLSSATYGAPTVGATVNLGWVPGYAPPVTATTDDAAADAVLLLSQDPPAVSGFAVVTLTQPITGVGLDCAGGAPCCVPTGLRYNRLTWTALTSAVITGFGAYEMQRSDPLTDWQTIMSHSSPTGASFNDYEARTNMASYYRIRATNVYNFAGAWSPTITGSIGSPGITGGPCLNATGSLIFTSNASQIGLYNLAYVQIFETDPEEQFVFPEADTLQIRRMFRRDYQVAFKPTERGGEAFSRLILVQAAAVSPPKLANMRALRDMGWADLPYVCVRDEVGDRWYASVVVPSGRVLRNRRLYYATVGIVEVTATSAVIDPAAV